MIWQLYTALSVLSLSLSVLLQRVLIHKNKLDPYAYAVTFQGLVAILLLIMALAAGLKLPNFSELLVPATIAIVFFGLGHIVYAKTLQVVEASAFSVFFATQAIWIMLFGLLFLEESLSVLQVIGSVLVIGSVGLLVKRADALTNPRSIGLGLLTGLMFGIAIIAFSYVGRYTDPLSWAAVSFVGTTLVSLLARPRTISKITPVLMSGQIGTLLLLAFLYGFGSYMMLLAYKDGDFALVTPLRQTSIIVTVLLALLFLKSERHSLSRKIISGIVSTVGVLLIIG